MQGNEGAKRSISPPRSIREIYERAERRGETTKLYPPEGPAIDVSDQLLSAANRAEDEGDEQRSAELWGYYEEQLLWESRAQIFSAIADLNAVWPGRKYELAVLVIREMMDLLGEQPVRKPLDTDTRNLVYRRDGYQCVACGEHEVHMLSVDHIVPVRLGGTNDPDNLRTLCRPCNSSKGARL